MLIGSAALVLIAIMAGYAYSAYKSAAIEQTFPRIGDLADVGGYRMNSVLVKAGTAADRRTAGRPGLRACRETHSSGPAGFRSRRE